MTMHNVHHPAVVVCLFKRCWYAANAVFVSARERKKEGKKALNHLNNNI